MEIQETQAQSKCCVCYNIKSALLGQLSPDNGKVIKSTEEMVWRLWSVALFIYKGKVFWGYLSYKTLKSIYCSSSDAQNSAVKLEFFCPRFLTWLDLTRQKLTSLTWQIQKMEHWVKRLEERLLLLLNTHSVVFDVCVLYDIKPLCFSLHQSHQVRIRQRGCRAGSGVGKPYLLSRGT